MTVKRRRKPLPPILVASWMASLAHEVAMSTQSGQHAAVRDAYLAQLLAELVTLHGDCSVIHLDRDLAS